MPHALTCSEEFMQKVRETIKAGVADGVGFHVDCALVGSVVYDSRLQFFDTPPFADLGCAVGAMPHGTAL